MSEKPLYISHPSTTHLRSRISAKRRRSLRFAAGGRKSKIKWKRLAWNDSVKMQSGAVRGLRPSLRWAGEFSASNVSWTRRNFKFEVWLFGWKRSRYWAMLHHTTPYWAFAYIGIGVHEPFQKSHSSRAHGVAWRFSFSFSGVFPLWPVFSVYPIASVVCCCFASTVYDYVLRKIDSTVRSNKILDRSRKEASTSVCW